MTTDSEMQWRDEGILLWVRRHGEGGAIVECLTQEHGRHSGLVRVGSGKGTSAMLQAGAQLSLEWSARLSDHLGTFKVDLVRSRSAKILADQAALSVLNAISALTVKFVPEREPNADLYNRSVKLLDAIVDDEKYWPTLYAQWELDLLSSIGFGLDLTRCAATGSRDDLVYVSPRSGRAVCRSSGAPFADRMLPLPAFLRSRGRASMGDVREALRTTGFFLETRACAALEIDKIPDARQRLLTVFDRMEFAPETSENTYNSDEDEWLESLGGGDSLRVPTP